MLTSEQEGVSEDYRLIQRVQEMIEIFCPHREPYELKKTHANTLKKALHCKNCMGGEGSRGEETWDLAEINRGCTWSKILIG